MGIKNIIGELTLNGKQVATVDQLPNAPKTPSKGLVYALSEDGTSAACTGFGTCADTDIVIASTYEGKPVTSISDSVFSYRSFTSIVLPKGVTSIGANAFWNCSSLESIVVPDSVTGMGDYAFEGCDSLTIYCEAEEQPEGWGLSWNFENGPVIWGAVLDIPAINDKFEQLAQTDSGTGSNGECSFDKQVLTQTK